MNSRQLVFTVMHMTLGASCGMLVALWLTGPDATLGAAQWGIVGGLIASLALVETDEERELRTRSVRPYRSVQSVLIYGILWAIFGGLIGTWLLGPSIGLCAAQGAGIGGLLRACYCRRLELDDALNLLDSKYAHRYAPLMYGVMWGAGGAIIATLLWGSEGFINCIGIGAGSGIIVGQIAAKDARRPTVVAAA